MRLVQRNASPYRNESVPPDEETNTMSTWTRSWVGAAAMVLAFAAVPGAIVITWTPGVADADVCASVGRRVRVGGCVNLADTMAPYVPPPAYYAPMPGDPPPPGAP